MSLPQLVPVPNLGVNLPPLPDNQKWALNRDTNTIVLIEFKYDSGSTAQNIPTITPESIALLNTTVEQASALINSQIQILEGRINTLESNFNIITLPTG